MYQQARDGRIKNFTGINDPYEPPLSPEIRLETVARSAEKNADLVFDYLVQQGFMLPAS